MSSSIQEITERSVLDIVIPEASELDIEDALRSSSTTNDDSNTATIISSITQRQLLFFGMLSPLVL